MNNEEGERDCRGNGNKGKTERDSSQALGLASGLSTRDQRANEEGVSLDFRDCAGSRRKQRRKRGREEEEVERCRRPERNQDG